MARSRFKRKNKNIVLLLISLVLLILLIIAVRATWNMYQNMNETKAKRDNAFVELEELKKRNQELTASIEYFKTEKGIDREIRERYAVKKEGEGVIVILEEEKTSSFEAQEEKPSLFSRFLEKIGF